MGVDPKREKEDDDYQMAKAPTSHVVHSETNAADIDHLKGMQQSALKELKFLEPNQIGPARATSKQARRF